MRSEEIRDALVAAAEIAGFKVHVMQSDHWPWPRIQVRDASGVLLVDRPAAVFAIDKNAENEK